MGVGEIRVNKGHGVNNSWVLSCQATNVNRRKTMHTAEPLIIVTGCRLCYLNIPGERECCITRYMLINTIAHFLSCLYVLLSLPISPQPVSPHRFPTPLPPLIVSDDLLFLPHSPGRTRWSVGLTQPWNVFCPAWASNSLSWRP